ncbi:MAG TPA: hypothetical protein PKW95_06795 [bacterium]|nr:hypothetical protein [bacterium]
MSDDAKYSLNNVVPFRKNNDGESPVLELSRRNIRQNKIILKFLFGLFLLVTVVACVLMAITGNWFFAALCFILGIYLMFRLDQRFGPRIDFVCPHCGKGLKLYVTPNLPTDGSAFSATCIYCHEEMACRLVE